MSTRSSSLQSEPGGVSVQCVSNGPFQSLRPQTASGILPGLNHHRSQLRSYHAEAGRRGRQYGGGSGKTREKEHTTPRIRWSSPTQLLIRPLLAYRWESGRDPEFSSRYGRM
ncbi:hypothetical protein N657DRAFT_128293 [Parathielavia appendiculata]|uniref:Uncharacterized protein n=1 Tax=Parathielavia appendiculata TaxID=2587402 RepID=A0AAN6TWC2_9PEZI|nr:hypothetical protein N657DRAFT_128293 [Parathielavia appendiculata]